MNSKFFIQLIILAIIAYATFFSKTKFELTENDLTYKTITVNQLSDIGTSKSYGKYTITTKNFPCLFLIDNSGAAAANWNIENKVKPNDTIEVGIQKNQVDKLSQKTKLKVYSLKENGNYIYNIENYKKEYNSRNDRYNFLGYILLIIIPIYMINNFKKHKTKQPLTRVKRNR